MSTRKRPRKADVAEAMRRSQAWLQSVWRLAQSGVASVEAEIDRCKLMLNGSKWEGGQGLLDPRGRFGRVPRHQHAEPYDAPDCGWCGNIRQWRGALKTAESALPLAREIEDDLIRKAQGEKLAPFWECIRDVYPQLRREFARQLWQRANPDRRRRK